MASSSTDIHPDIIQTGILPKLDGQSLSTAACTSTSLHELCNKEKLWENICKSTWPSISDPRITDVISTFPDGYRSFFRDSFPVLHNDTCGFTLDQTSELISAVDVHYQDKLVYSRVEVTNTKANCFLSPPAWIELNDSHTEMTRPGFSKLTLETDEPGLLAHLNDTVTMNWILIDPTRRRAGNFSSVKPVIVRRHWMTNEIQLRYVVILAGAEPEELVQCRIEVTCGGREGEELRVREVILQLIDLETRCLTGKECLVIFQGAMGSERRKKGKEGEEIEKYEEFLEVRNERRERTKRKEMRLNMASKSIQMAILGSLLLWVSGLLLF